MQKLEQYTGRTGILSYWSNHTNHRANIICTYTFAFSFSTNQYWFHDKSWNLHTTRRLRIFT